MTWLIRYKLRNLGRKADPDKAFVKRLENRLLAEAGMAKPGFAPVFRWAAAGVLATVVLGATGTYAYASDEVLPGDLLYPVRRGLETAEEKVAWPEQRKLKVQLKHLQRRLKEDGLLMKRSGKLPDARLTEFHGELETIIDKTGKLAGEELPQLDRQAADLAESYSDLTENSDSMTDILVDRQQDALKRKLDKMEQRRQKTFYKVIKKIEQRKARGEQRRGER